MKDVPFVFCAGDRQIRLVALEAVRRDPAAEAWSWTAADSPQIRPEHARWFAGMDECKPAMNGQAVMVSSSADGGMAVIRLRDKACLFYAQGNNAHGIEMVGEDLLAAALSKTGDELRLYPFDPTQQGPAHGPAWAMPLIGGHGVLWDGQRELLWALGTDELLELRIHRRPAIAGAVQRRWPLPQRHGHDLMWWDDEHLVVTADSGVWLFDLAKRAFSPAPALGAARNVKSINRNGRSGEIMYTQGEPTFTTRVRFVGGEDLPIADIELYKARWAVCT